MKIKTKKPDPVRITWQWEKRFRRTQIFIVLFLVLILAIVYNGYARSEAKSEAQDAKIQSLYGVMVNMTNIMNKVGALADKNEFAIYYLNEAHVKIDGKHGSVLEHGLVDKKLDTPE